VLHIDIDFFVDPVVYYRTDTGTRPSGREFRADPLEAVTRFAEEQCLLDARTPAPGASVVHNDEVFGAIEERLRVGSLTAPFEMIHVDAHSDLGVGENDRSFERITTDILHRPIAERPAGVRSGAGALGFGNWLAYCLACRFIDKLTIVRHPNAKHDFHAAYFADYIPPDWHPRVDRREAHVRMQPLTREELDARRWQLTGRWGAKLAHPVEQPLIPTTIVQRAAFQLDRAPDFLFLCLSPGYSPASADRIFRALKKYLRKV
jgi:hypothetical protein